MREGGEGAGGNEEGGGKMEGMGGWERGEKQGEGGFGRALDVWAVWG